MTADYDRDVERWYDSLTVSAKLPIVRLGDWTVKLWRWIYDKLA